MAEVFVGRVQNFGPLDSFDVWRCNFCLLEETLRLIQLFVERCGRKSIEKL